MKNHRKWTRLLAFFLAAALLAAPVSGLTYNEYGDEITVIVLDPGHGGLDSGIEGEYDGVTVEEEALVLRIANYCKEYLEQNYWNVQVLMTRTEDVKVTLEDRVAFAEECSADYLLSLHLNGSNGGARGALAIVPKGSYRPEQAEASQTVAAAILAKLEELGLQNDGFMIRTNDGRYPDGSKKDYYYIVRGCVNANIPGIILEHAFLDNEKDYREFLDTEEKLKALGIADALGLAESLGLEPMSQKPDRRPTSADLGDTPFEDVREGDWFYDDVTYVWEQGLMVGMSGTMFGPAEKANRAMVVTLLYRLDGAEYPTETVTFADVEPGLWYYEPVEWAVAGGITTGVSETEFAPGRNVIREQFVTFLYRYAMTLGCDVSIESEPAFSDADTISAYAVEPVSWAAEAGLVTGYDDGTFQPLRELNRAELAVLMHRFDRWLMLQSGELSYEWTISETEKALFVGESFNLTVTNQFGEAAPAEWVSDTEGVVAIDGNTITAVAPGTALLTCEVEGQVFDCLVEVIEEVHTWTLSHDDVTIKVGESFYLTLKNEEGETADVAWTASKPGFVTISGSKITGSAKGTITISGEWEGVVYECVVRVKSA